MRTIRYLVVALLAFGYEVEAQTQRRRAFAQPSNVSSVFFGEFYPVEVRPGGTKQFALYEDLGAGPFHYRPATGVHVRWTLEPQLGSASIDSNGLLTVREYVSSGMTYRVYANLNHGERIISLPVYVYRVGADPFLDGRVWRQSAEISCDGSADIPVANGIRELRFHVSGTYTVAWQPFELYTDFWGPYTFNGVRKRVTFGVSGGNYIPEDVKGEGEFEIVFLGPPTPTTWGTNIRSAQLRLKNVHLGSSRSDGPRAVTPCGMVFSGNMEVP